MLSGTFRVERRAVRYVVDFIVGVGLNDLVAPGFPVQNDRDEDVPISPEQLRAARGTYHRFVTEPRAVPFQDGTDPDLLDSEPAASYSARSAPARVATPSAPRAIASSPSLGGHDRIHPLLGATS